MYRHLSRVLGALAWAYAIALPVLFQFSDRPQQFDTAADWIALPLQLAAIFLIGLLLYDSRRSSQSLRGVWSLVLSYVVVSVAATCVWNWFRHGNGKESLDLADLLYLIDYWILTAAFALLFRRAGGSFKTAQVWLDAATMMVVQLAALWSFFLTPSFPPGLNHGITLAATCVYSITLAAMLTMAALVCLEMPNFRGRSGVFLLVGAAAAVAAWEIIWLSSWLVDFEFVGAYYNYGDVLCCACIISAVSAMQEGAPVRSEPIDSERQADGFMPALALLLAIALVAGNLATTRRLDTWVLIGLVALCMVLLVTRQRRVRSELRALNRQLALQVADARLTELVRRSTDLIVVVGASRLVSFASPAAESMLSLPVAQSIGMPAEMLFGAAHQPSLKRFLERIFTEQHALLALELRVDGASGQAPEEPRIFNLNAANQLENPLINGVVLTIGDVTARRALEREVLDVATRERVRLCADIHDGLGQELTGIAMLLQAAATAPNPDPVLQAGQLRSIVGYVNRSIVSARDLARGLSPLQVVGGSLSGALQRLAQDAGGQVPIRVNIDSQCDERLIDEFSADHLYRIAQEAVVNALRHSGCEHVAIEMSQANGMLTLDILDDGRGISTPSSSDSGLGMRLMEYRARMLGGSLRTASASGGTRVEVRMPLRQAAPG